MRLHHNELVCDHQVQLCIVVLCLILKPATISVAIHSSTWAVIHLFLWIISFIGTFLSHAMSGQLLTETTCLLPLVKCYHGQYIYLPARCIMYLHETSTTFILFLTFSYELGKSSYFLNWINFYKNPLGSARKCTVTKMKNKADFSKNTLAIRVFYRTAVFL